MPKLQQMSVLTAYISLGQACGQWSPNPIPDAKEKTNSIPSLVLPLICFGVYKPPVEIVACSILYGICSKVLQISIAFMGAHRILYATNSAAFESYLTMIV